MNPVNAPASANDPRVIRALEEYTAEGEAGPQQGVDAGGIGVSPAGGIGVSPVRSRRDDFLARHPDIAGVLAECLDALDFVRSAVPQLESPDVLAPGFEPVAPLGDFRIIREIGRGGMGVVYEAEQLSLGRRVALKVLPFAAALDSKQLQRFKNEAHAAAGLQHTNIVPVYFVGCERGVHFYAMQFVEGQTLAALIQDLRQIEGRNGEAPSEPRPLGSGTAEPHENQARQGTPAYPPRPPEDLASELISGRWAPGPQGVVDSPPTGPYVPSAPIDQTQQAATATPPVGALSTEHSTSRPAFFRTVANLGIQAAEALEHAHSLGVIHRDIKPANLMVDARGNLWITDFGLAHCQSQAGLTMSGDLVGTLRYMSPEQALAKRVLVDHRTDIYSLGVTLYELLTLEPAFAGKDREELLRQIAFEEPKAPRRLNKAIPAELNTIVLKAIEKNPEERYVTAQELADDLERFLRDEPIRAKRPSLVQRARKWGRRHPSVVRSALVVVFLSLAGTALIMWREKHWTEQAFNEVWEEQKKTQAALHRAEENNQISLAVQRFLQDKLLTQADPTKQADALLRARGKSAQAKQNPTIRELLDRAAAELTPQRIEANFPGQPLVQAEILQTVGNTYRGLGDYAQAIAHLERSRDLFEALVGPDHDYSLATLGNLALAYRGAGRLPEAIGLYEHVWEKSEYKLGPDDTHTLTTLNNLAGAYHAAGNLPEAIRLYEQVREKKEKKLGPDDPGTLATLNNLAGAYQAAGNLPKAIPLFEQVREKIEQKLGPNHPQTLIVLTNLAQAYRDAGRLGEAIPLLEQVREKQQEKLPPDHPDTLTTLNNLAAAYWSAGNLDRSVPLFEDLLRRRRAKSRDDHPETFRVAFNLGVNYRDAGRLHDAVRMFDEWLPRAQAKLMPGQDPLPFGRWVAGETYAQARQFDRAVGLAREDVAQARRIFAGDDPRLAGVLANMGSTLLRAQQSAEAETVLRECLVIREIKEPDSWKTFNTRSLLGGALLGQKKYPDAEPLLVQGYDGLVQAFDGVKNGKAMMQQPDKVRLTEALERLVQLYNDWGKPERANQWRKKLEEVKIKTGLSLPAPKDHEKDSPQTTDKIQSKN